MSEADARRALALAGVGADGPLHKVFSYSNDVWVGDDHVALIGRVGGPRLLAHQARILEALPEEVPHAGLVAFEETADLEWMVLARATGVTVHDAWPRLGQRDRRAVAAQLAAALEALHATTGVERFRHHWVDEPDLETYQQPPASRFPVLLGVARTLPIADHAFLDALQAFMDERLDAFAPPADEERVLVHSDVHNKNLLCDLDAPGGLRLTAILDFEFARPAARDLELDVILRYGVLPLEERADEAHRREIDLLARWLREDYPALFAHPHLVDRLEAYAVMYELRQCVGWAAQDPDAHVWYQLRELVEGRGYISSSVGTR